MAEVLVYYTVFEDVQHPVDIKFIEVLPEKLKNEILQYRKQSDINRLTAGKHLLKHVIKECGFGPETINNYQIDAMGKPFIEGFFPFNITHSGIVVACAVIKSETCIGIDLEKIREIEVTKFDKQFSPPEMMQILAAPSPMEKFFDFWTIKEAVMKADGRGMRIPLHSIRIKNDHCTVDDTGQRWNLQKLDLHESVKSHISYKEDKVDIIVKFLSPRKIFA